MDLANLDETTRRYMLDEINGDINDNALYMSQRLSERGRADYPGLLLEAAENGHVASLAAALRASGRLNAMETATRNGRMYAKRVPSDAPDTMAEGEFNRFYARAVCLRAVDDNIGDVIVYRAKVVARPRPGSEAKIGATFDPALLLADLRVSVGIDTALGIPAGPNSGLSVRLPS